ncbi:MAG: TRAP transporter large permease subunit, partial [Alphaproteobacteria bacterium]
VVVGAFLAASTGIVGATVVTMGLLSLPTMLRHNYSPELATGVIAASGTLGQIIPPSIVIVLLGTLAGDLYSAAQEIRAQSAGCPDALTYLGQAAVVSVGTLFQAAILPGILLAALYGLYAFGFALLNPSKAPPVRGEAVTDEVYDRSHVLRWMVGAPVGVILVAVALTFAGVAGDQDITVDTYSDVAKQPELRTNVSEQCKKSLIALHGQEKWDRAVAQAKKLAELGGGASRKLTEEERAKLRAEKIATRAPIGSGVLTLAVLLALMLVGGRAVKPSADPRRLWIGMLGVLGMLAVDALFISPVTSPGATFLIEAVPMAVALWGAWYGVMLMGSNELLRVVFPPLVLIVAVLGSILGGITNPTPAAALGAGGAIMLAAYRKLRDQDRSGRMIIIAAFAILIMILVGINFDLRINRDVVPLEDWIAFVVAQAAYSAAILGILYSCWVLWRGAVLTPVVKETAKVTSMVFTILIGSQLLNLVIISFGGEHYIQAFLRSFDQEWTAFLIVMAVLFILGFVLDFLEIIYIVIPIVGPVIYGGSMDPKWVTIMIAVNLQTSFLTPPFGFALFYLRGVAPPEVTTGHIYRGIVPFVIIQVVGLVLLALFPDVVTILPDLFPQGG